MYPVINQISSYITLANFSKVSADGSPIYPNFPFNSSINAPVCLAALHYQTRTYEEHLDLHRPRPVRQNDRYKTELCRFFGRNGTCMHGNHCTYAHSIDELRPYRRHPLYKTRLCRRFHSTGFCKYGASCDFIHYQEEYVRVPLGDISRPSNTSHRNVGELKTTAPRPTPNVSKSFSSNHVYHNPSTLPSRMEGLKIDCSSLGSAGELSPNNVSTCSASPTFF